MIIRPYIFLQIVFEIFRNFRNQMRAVFAVDVVVVAAPMCLAFDYFPDMAFLAVFNRHEIHA